MVIRKAFKRPITNWLSPLVLRQIHHKIVPVAAESVLEQTVSLRDSISGVNLDEESRRFDSF